MALIQALSKQWQRFNHRILLRKVPHAVLSWRYLLPGQSQAVKLHKRTFLQAWQPLPRPFWWAIALYSYTLWYLCYGWLQWARVWCNRSTELASRQGIGRLQQLAHLWVLTFGHSTPPGFYYQYQLYRLPERRWLEFVYTHELPHWHLMMSPAISDRDSMLMNHKQAFAEAMLQRGLPAVPTEQFLPAGQKVFENQVFCRQSLFFKPARGSRKEGCFELTCDASMAQYRLEANPDITSRGEILAFVQRQVATRPYLIQPLLRNHPELARRSHTNRLLTLRLVTIRRASRVSLLAANLELPLNSDINSVLALPIGLVSGAVLLNQDTRCHTGEGAERLALRERLSDYVIPEWDALQAVVVAAHECCPSLTSIGWDLAVTDTGIRLIEGNINWSVAAHQHTGKPLAFVS